MLKNIPNILSPELLKILMEMGHNDYIVLVDANYPATSGAQRLVRASGVEVTDMLDAVLQLYPLDTFVDDPVVVMDPGPGTPTPPIWSEFKKIILKHDTDKAFKDFHMMDRFEYYEFAKKAYAIVQTGTTAHWANLSLKKGAF